MVHKKVSKDDPDADGALAPAYTQRLDLQPIPKYRMPEEGAPANAALMNVRLVVLVVPFIVACRPN